MTTSSGPTRRALLHLGGAGLAAGAVAACSGSDDPAPGTPDPTTDAAPGSPEPTTDPDPDAEAGITVPVADVPEGGSVFLQSDNVVVSQPAAGEFRAFDGTCPHEGCAVSRSGPPTLGCPCHGSQFDMDTGAVLNGPAPRGLTALDVEVDGDTVVVRR